MINRILWSIVAILILVSFYMVYDKRKTTDEVFTKMQAQWTAWEQFEKQQCKLTEKTYGMTVQTGKSTTLDNSHVYKCSDGTQYILTGSALDRIHGCLIEQNYCTESTLKLVPQI